MLSGEMVLDMCGDVDIGDTMLTHLIGGLSLATQTVCLAATPAFSNGSSLHHGGGNVRQDLRHTKMKKKKGRRPG